MDEEAFVAHTRRLGPLAHLATVTPDGLPHVAPIHVDWHNGYLYSMIGISDTKTRNLTANPNVCLHYQVGKATNWDSLIVWGRARLLDAIEDKRRLWTGVLGYDLDRFSPGGPDGSPETGFLQITVDRAVMLPRYGMDGREVYGGTGDGAAPSKGS
jgi:nitroimidazol reductase NimA-like FMN-containing flavoprotein (pyridoxamine 5'-phosphate oxidase superfamily)